MKKLLFILCAFLVIAGADAQSSKDPSSWTISATGENGSYNIVFHVSLDPNWHIWSLHPGGDGSLIAPSFTLKGGNYTLDGDVGEQGIAVETTFDGVDGKVKFYMNEAQFNQTIRGRSGDVIKGEYTYQLCSNTMCLPPKTVPFEVKLP